MKVKLSGKVVEAELLVENNKTVWVKLKDGNIIQRHREKHLLASSFSK